MKKQFMTGAAIVASCGVAAAQGLYDIAPNDDAQESSPIKWIAGISYTWDDNVSPTVTSGTPGFEDDVSSSQAWAVL